MCIFRYAQPTNNMFQFHLLCEVKSSSQVNAIIELIIILISEIIIMNNVFITFIQKISFCSNNFCNYLGAFKFNFIHFDFNAALHRTGPVVYLNQFISIYMFLLTWISIQKPQLPNSHTHWWPKCCLQC